MAKKKVNRIEALTEALGEMTSQKNLSQEVILQALKESIENAYSKLAFDDEVDCELVFDIPNGDISLYWIRRVVDHLENSFDWTLDIELEKARETDKNIQIGDLYKTLVPLESLSRPVIQRVKQNFTQKIKEAQKKLVYDKFKESEGRIVTGEVEKVEEGKYVIVDLGKTHGYMPYKETIPGEKYRVGDTIKVYIKEVSIESKKEAILLSRSDARFIFQLFSKEIVEIEDGLIYIRSIARLPGIRTKIVVSSKDPNIDAAGTCIGKNGTRIGKIAEQLNNGQEKIDVIQYYDDPLMMIKGALFPAIVEGIATRQEKITATIFNKQTKTKEQKTYLGNVADVVVSNETFSLAIGPKGQNAFLAKKLSKFDKLNIIRVDDALGKIAYKRMVEIEADYFGKGLTKTNIKVNPEVETIPVKELEKENIPTPTPTTVEELVEVTPTPIYEAKHIDVVEKEEPKTVVEKKEEKEEDKGPSKKSIKKEEELKKALEIEEQRKKGMAIYTQEELEQFEEEDIEDDEDEEIDYEEYDEYYDSY